MKPPPPIEFAAVPDGPNGQPMHGARDNDSTDFYLNWLADYLYRPSPKMPASAILSTKAASSKLTVIEIEIAWWIWEHPFDDYPPEACGPTRHWDFLHRVKISKILSRVPDHDTRFKLLKGFYQELMMDSTK